MGLIDRNLLPDEEILFRTRKHVIIFFFPLLVTLIALFTQSYLEANPILVKVAKAPWALAAILWCYYGLEYFFSDYVVTNKRVRMQEGFFFRHANELRLTTIAQVNVDQNLIGIILNYGTVSLNAMGAFDAYPNIAKPNVFRNSVNIELDKLAR